MEGNELKGFLQELIEFLKSQDIAEFDLEQADLKVRLKFARLRRLALRLRTGWI